MRLSLCLLIVATFWAALYIPALGSRELQGEEARRVLPGRTMLQTGEWAVPRSGGEVYNRKPPLVNWASAAAIQVTGQMDEWTVRTPSILMMLALGISMLLCLRLWLGNEQALLAALITLTNIGFLEKGRLVEIEALYMSLFGIALVLWLGLRWQGRELASWVASGAMMGLGFLAKGPPHVWYFYALIIAVLQAEHRLKDLRSWKHLAGLLVFFAVWMPWGLINSHRNPLKDSAAVWQDQITHRLGFAEFNLLNYLLQVPQSLLNFMPWVLLLPLCWRPTVVNAWKDGGRHGQWLLGLRKGLLWGFFVIALMPSSRPRFMLPLNVAAAILVAEAVSCMSINWLATWGRRWRIAMACFASLGLIVLAFGSGSVATHLSEHQFQATGWVLWLIAGALIVSWLWRNSLPKTPLTLAICTGFALAVVGGAYMFAMVPRKLPREKLRPFAAKIIEHTGPDAPIMLYKVEEHMWPFYLGMRCYEVADLKERPNIAFHWLMVPRKFVEGNSSKRSELIRLYGAVIDETPLHDPTDPSEYVLMHLAGK